MRVPRRITLPIAVLVGVAAGLAALVGLGYGSGVLDASDAPFAIFASLAALAIASIPLLAAHDTDCDAPS